MAIASPAARISATKEFGWYDADGRTMVTRGRRGEPWRVEREPKGARVRVARPDGTPTPWQRGLVARAFEDGVITVDKKRYRGDVIVLPVEQSVEIVNRLGLEDYLKGVVPVEMGTRPREDSSALQAQSVASRTYALSRMGDARRPFDVRASTQDQVYGGADVEYGRASDAVDATRGLVIQYHGQLADAPFHATCGGTTAEPSEIWRAADSPYLNRVSDRIPGSDRFYCDIAPRYRWTRTLSGSDLNAALDQYLKAYSAVPGGRPGPARGLTVRARTESGRVAILDVVTERGTFPVKGNDIRYVLRAPGGEILSSTYFSVEPETGRDGFVSRVTLRGQGNGHGVGMCQWGAIGRSRAGQSFRSILGTYYPGTSVGPLQ